MCAAVWGASESCDTLVWPVDSCTKGAPAAVSARSLQQVSAQVMLLLLLCFCYTTQLEVLLTNWGCKSVQLLQGFVDGDGSGVPTGLHSGSASVFVLVYYVLSVPSGPLQSGSGQLVLENPDRTSEWAQECFNTFFFSLKCSPPSFLPPGLSVGGPLCQKRLVPPLHACRKRVWSLEEPLHLLRVHPGPAHLTGNAGNPEHPHSAKRQRDRGRRGSEEGEEDQAANQTQNSGGEKWVNKYVKSTLVHIMFFKIKTK